MRGRLISLHHPASPRAKLNAMPPAIHPRSFEIGTVVVPDARFGRPPLSGGFPRRRRFAWRSQRSFIQPVPRIRIV